MTIIEKMDKVSLMEKRYNEKMYVLTCIEKALDCKWLNYKYSDLLPYLKNHNISLDKILREYKGT